MDDKARMGLEKLKKASLLMLLGSLVGAAGSLAVYPMLMAPAAPRVAHHLVLASVGVALLASLVGFALMLVAVYVFLVPSFSNLREHSEELYGTPAKMIKIGLVYGLLVLIAGIALLIAGAAGLPALIGLSVLLLIAGAVLMLVGLIGVIIGLVKLKDETGETLFLVAAILLVVGIFVPVLQFVAWILIYIAAGSALKKVS